MALPPLDMSGGLEDEPAPDLDTSGPDDDSDSSADVDPMFAADLDETGLNLDDKQTAALQRAILGLWQSQGGGSGGMPPGGAPAAPF